MPEDRYSEIGKRIRVAREELGLSQGVLAQKVGFNTATALSLIESGDRKVDIETLERIGTELHQKIGYFLGNEEQLIDFKVALRSVKEFGSEERKAVSEFIEFLRKKHAK